MKNNIEELLIYIIHMSEHKTQQICDTKKKHIKITKRARMDDRNI